MKRLSLPELSIAEDRALYKKQHFFFSMIISGSDERLLALYPEADLYCLRL